MSNEQSLTVDRADSIADAVIDRVGPNIVLALPLGLGKANHLANALYDRAARNPHLSLTILTALTPEVPRYGDDLRGRFLGPVVERLFGGYPELRYARDRRNGTLPANIRVEEFFFLAGSQLGVASAQQNHICANYTHAMGYLLERGVNVIAQLLARRPGEPDGASLSLSCNTDLGIDLLAARRQGRADFLFLGQVNDELPFMGGDAAIPRGECDFLLAGDDCQFPLFAPPREAVHPRDYAAAMHVARLVPDGGTLQIGIGSLGDAVAHCLILRHRNNRLFRDLAAHLPGTGAESHLEPFDEGLHGLSEMLVETFLDLREAGILKREVDGRVLNAAFFLGSRAFYRRLGELAEDERDKLAMRSVHFVNALYGDEDTKRRGRVRARFVNKAMMATLLGDVISDGLESGQVVSGVGGQYNFAAQAFELAGARSIIVVPATRESSGRTVSNIRWTYGNTTVPRHLRDIVVTEYGVADLRGRTDRDVIAAMLTVTDSRFQEELLEKATAAGKIESGYRIPAPHRNNLPETIKHAFTDTQAEDFPDFPFGSDFTDTERALLPLLDEIRQTQGRRVALIRLAAGGLIAGSAGDRENAILERMGLDRARGIRARFYRYLVRGNYRSTSRDTD